MVVSVSERVGGSAPAEPSAVWVPYATSVGGREDSRGPSSLVWNDWTLSQSSRTIRTCSAFRGKGLAPILSSADE